jgi:hypothetical protein
MADVMSILSAGYKTAGSTIPSHTQYVAVDPKVYEGTWSGTYADKKTFSVKVSDVSGFRAQVKYQSGSTVQNGSVLIKDNSFRIGNTKFTLIKAATATHAATAQIKNVIIDPATGGTFLDTAIATKS